MSCWEREFSPDSALAALSSCFPCFQPVGKSCKRLRQLRPGTGLSAPLLGPLVPSCLGWLLSPASGPVSPREVFFRLRFENAFKQGSSCAFSRFSICRFRHLPLWPSAKVGKRVFLCCPRQRCEFAPSLHAVQSLGVLGAVALRVFLLAGDGKPLCDGPPGPALPLRCPATGTARRGRS